ncbi:ABC-type sulfate/molybdate transport systems ATPase subunit [Microbulbifer hydrolyticus]|uniref:ABC-type sulfate/molybdate transport systems ATPase subunit n=1 Tax=Microbulbifer hydrolyticus TaxID=48074 RepID=A0AA89TLE8_9GAMM|nr:ABC-type sulfate/molybdate transport systems ATPase subunit [Microbulbifer hydrolyticus]
MPRATEPFPLTRYYLPVGLAIVVLVAVSEWLLASCVLLLDEPSNDLDIETLRALEEALLSFPGCAMVISHDRWFLDRVATHILAHEGYSNVAFFEGNYTEYHEDFVKRNGENAIPHRMQYKKIKT